MNKKYLLATQKFYQDPSIPKASAVWPGNNPFLHQLNTV
jgi:hypothetical protein